MNTLKNNSIKKIIFVSGTRADFGKIKSLILRMQKNNQFKVYVFVTGMHLIKAYGSTWDEIRKAKIKNIYKFKNQKINDKEDLIFSRTIIGFSKYAKKIKPDLVFVHGDRIEALATTVSSVLNSIKIAHIEGGEVSGTKDEILRHAISKLVDFHFVSNNLAKKRLIQLGENNKNIYVIGSPEVDLINNFKLPSLAVCKRRYGIKYKSYSVFIFHSATEEIKHIKRTLNNIFTELLNSKQNYIIIYPNNDPGSDKIIEIYKKFKNIGNFKFFPSMRFEHYQTLLKNSEFIIGNSSSGVREAPSVGIPSINIGIRQFKRSNAPTIINCGTSRKEIKKALISVKSAKKMKSTIFGKGNSNIKLEKILNKNSFWSKKTYKKFIDI